MKKISLEELLKNKRSVPYREQYDYVAGLISAGKILPMKSAESNGKNPALPLSYWLVTQRKDYSRFRDELSFDLDPRIVPDFYLHHLPVYEKDRPFVLQLSDYLRNHSEELRTEVSENERSFAIWHREKFLQKGPGFRILKNCGVDPCILSFYTTSEPLAYYSADRSSGQNILMIENKDTFFSMRRALLNGKTEILGTTTGTLIYGAGKGIWKSLDDFDLCVEPYMKDPQNHYLYFGDLDYEGIGIYDKVREIFRSAAREIIPFAAAYRKMIEKAAVTGFDELPETREKQNRDISCEFFTYFDPETAARIKELLENGRYIPQEILNISDF